MSLAELSIKRPVFISSIITIILIVGYISINKIAVNLFPNIDFPVVSIYTAYPGAAPKEIETQISKVIEDEISTIANLKSVKSTSMEGASQIIAEFNLDVNIQDAKQNVREKLTNIKNQLPKDAKDPIIWLMDPAAAPIMILALVGNKDINKLYEISDQKIKNLIEQSKDVGLVEIWGGREREILVNLDRTTLKEHNISAAQISKQIALAGENIPLGKFSKNSKETIFRTIGEYNSIDDINNVIVNFVGNDIPITVADIAKIENGLKDEKSRTYVNGKPAVFIAVFRQSGANIIAVVKNIKSKLENVNKQLAQIDPSLKLNIVKDDSKLITANVSDVKETIFIGIILTILVVYFFLGNMRSTIITGLALPTSLLGAFSLMYMCGFSINIMSLLALSLAVGLLIDDAIVVRENIFRHIQNGESPAMASLKGTREVTLAVIGTTLTIVAVFGPVAFLYGIVGKFFKEFGLTVCFAMGISLFDSLTIAPMLSTYFAGKVKLRHHVTNDGHSTENQQQPKLPLAERFQDWLEVKYISVLNFSLKHPIVILSSSILIFVASIFSAGYISKTFLPAQDNGEFSVNLELSPGSDLNAMDKTSHDIIKVLQAIPEIEQVVSIIGNRDGAANSAHFYVTLVSDSKRSINTSKVKEIVTEKLKPFAYANPLVTDIDMVGAGMRPFNLLIKGETNTKGELEEIANKVFEKLKNHPGLSSVDFSDSEGKPEIQVKLKNDLAKHLGISTKVLGEELRTQIDGATPSIFRANGYDLDVRVRVKEDQRDLESNFNNIYVPNTNNSLLKLSSFAELNKTTGPSNIQRSNKVRFLQISADVKPNGPGMAQVISDIKEMFANEIKLPLGMSYEFLGQSESFQELIENIVIALILGLTFIYLVLASLYESYIIPITIMLVMPLAIIGAFFALLITNHSLDLFSMIGCIMLLGLATKNSILLVDYANQKLKQGYSRYDAIVEAGRTRLRPILMTTIALIAGMVPVAIGINEASKQRTSMGIALIGGLISSTLLTLIVIPAAFTYIDKMRSWGRKILKLDTINRNI